jgi:hypothetical protein
MKRDAFEHHAAACFRTLYDGRRLYCPWGMLFGRSGYLLDTAESEQRIRVALLRWAKLQMAVWFAVAVPIFVVLPLWLPRSPIPVLTPTQLAGIVLGAIGVLAVALFLSNALYFRALTKGMRRVSIHSA